MEDTYYAVHAIAMRLLFMKSIVIGVGFFGGGLSGRYLWVPSRPVILYPVRLRN